MLCPPAHALHAGSKPVLSVSGGHLRAQEQALRDGVMEHEGSKTMWADIIAGGGFNPCRTSVDLKDKRARASGVAAAELQDPPCRAAVSIACLP